MLVNKLIKEKQKIKSSKKQIHSVASVKKSIEEAINAVIIKRNICSEQLNIYAEKSVQKHLNFVWSIETMFLSELHIRALEKLCPNNRLWSWHWTESAQILTLRNSLI